MSDEENQVRAVFSKLRAAEEGSSYGTLAYRVKNILLARLHQDGEHLVLKVGHDAKDSLLDSGSPTFTTKPHYDGTDYILIPLAKLKSREAAAVIRDAYDQLADPAKLRSIAKTSLKRIAKKTASDVAAKKKKRSIN